jgi:hypothetical protein
MLPTCKGHGKVTRAAQRFINLGAPADFFAIVKGQRLDPSFKRLEHFSS